MTPSPVSEALKSWPRRLRALPIPVGLLCAAVLHGCSLAYDLSTSQCSVNADCESIGQGLICGADHVCQVDTSGCATNEECLTDGLAACIRDPGKDPSKTRGTCVPLQSPECPYVLPLDTNVDAEALRKEDVVILGAFTNITLSARLYNYDFAVTEFENINGGISTSGGTRPVLMVACNGDATSDTTGDFQGGLDRSMDHLIQLHVPGVLSGLETDDLKRIFEEKGKDAKMFFMSSGESDSTLNALLDNGLVWETLPGGSSLAKAYKPMVDRTITYLQNKGMLTGTARIANVVSPDIRTLADMSNTLQSDPTDGGITFNGVSVLQNIRDENFKGFTTISSIADKNADLSTTVSDLLAFKPHIIISAGASEFLTKIMPSLEQQWDASTGGQARPFYVLSPYQYNRSALTTAIQGQPTIQQRVIGLNAPAATDPTIYNSYVSRFHTAHGTLDPYEGYENFYDSAYYLLYAASAAAPALTDGASMVTGMGRLIQGPPQGLPYEVGPDDMAEAIGTLVRGGNIQLIGAGGPPNFNIATGGKDDAGSIWCVDATRATKSDVLRYQASDGSMQGTFPCFPDY